MPTTKEFRPGINEFLTTIGHRKNSLIENKRSVAYPEGVGTA
jgi:hypothetical protein